MVDRWLVELFADATAGADPSGLALVAVGGYGRAELAPGSDLDLLLLDGGGAVDVAGLAERLWYPVWDEGLKLGHAVRTVKEALALAADDLDTATSLLEARHLAGDEALSRRLADEALASWRKRGRRWLGRLADSVEERHAAAGEVAFLLEPDLKSGRGGLRDVHALRWAERARQVLFADDHHSLESAYRTLLDTRVELHRRTGRGEVLLLQEQDAVAEALGDPDADVLMARVAAAGRRIAWTSDEAWHRIRSRLKGPTWSIARRDRDVAPGVVLRDGEIHLADDADPAGDPGLALRTGAAAARLGTRVDRAGLDRLAAEVRPMPEPWPGEAVASLVELLRTGHPAVGIVESLDQRGVWEQILPEWEVVRSRPQRNAYHRFTVDRHLCEAAAGAAAHTDDVDRPDLLLVGTWLHDIGKGRPGDHTQVGMELVAAIGRRMGLPDADVAVLVDLVRHHLLLPDVATRRDVSDEATISAVAGAVGSLGTLRLLAALTEADSIATGPSAWGAWKAALVAELVDRTAQALGDASTPHRPDTFPTPEQRALLHRGQEHIEAEGTTLTIVVADRAGLFSRVAGVLALHGLDVLAADALSEDGWALECIRVEHGLDLEIDWPRVIADVREALTGRLALEARLATRARHYAHRFRPRRAGPARPTVRFDDGASATATVIEVHAPDGVGVLYRITRALAEMGLDIRVAKVQTLGDTVVDAFYAVNGDGSRIEDRSHRAEIERAVLHALGASG